MARPSKIEVCAINIRIPSDRERDYVTLIDSAHELKLGVNVFGDTFVAISQFDEKTGMGIISKYTEIDIDGDWFDINDFTVVGSDEVEGVVLPENLKPNHSSFYFQLDPSLHVIVFETYSDSKSLSSRSVEKYFKNIFSKKTIREVFGHVEADIVKSYGEVERIVSLPDLKELRLIIRRPNSDDVSGDLAAEIEERLRAQNGEEYEEILRSKDGDALKPNERTKKLSVVAAENGQVSAKSIVNGVLVSHDTNEKPLKEVDTYNSDVTNTITMFQRMTKEILSKISNSRKSLAES